MSVCVLGSINLDVVSRVTRLPRPGETVQGLGTRRFPGGKGANQALAAAKMGSQTCLIGAVGKDAAAAELIAFLEAGGVDLSALSHIEATPTGHAYISVDANGENTIVVDSGANAALSPSDITPDVVGSAKVYLSQLETPIPVVAALFQTQAAKNGIKILNAAPAIDDAKALFASADILVLNQTELLQYAGECAPLTDPKAIVAVARSLLQTSQQAVVVTLGAEGAILVTASDAVVAPGVAVEVVDTTGAGDCFCGALAAFLSQGSDLTHALNRANAAAALAVGRHGAGASIPTLLDVECFLRDHSGRNPLPRGIATS